MDHSPIPPAPQVARARRAKSGRQLILWIAATCLATVVLFEATLRVIAYSGVSWGSDLRRPHLYADRWSDPFYFQLAQRWTGEPGPLPPENSDPRLGWVSEGMDREEFRDEREAHIGERRPVLLFGDSFIRCMMDSDNCFEGWMRRSPSSASHVMLNFGVRAYGIDQIAMLTRLALERWRGRNALVVIGIFVEDDLDRAILDYRGWPKPRFRLDSKRKLIEPGPVQSPEEYAAANPLWKRSLAWRWLLHGSGWLPERLVKRLTGAHATMGEKQVLCRAILERLEQDLQAAGIEHFYALFPSADDCINFEPRSWQESFLLRWLNENRLPYVNVKRDLLRAALEQDRHPSDFFALTGPWAGHLTPDGNEVAFSGLLRGIALDFDHQGSLRPPHFDHLHSLSPPDSGWVRIESGWSRRFQHSADRERILLSPPQGQAALVACRLRSPAQRFLATAKWVAPEGQAGGDPITLEVLVDGASVSKITLGPSNPPAEIVVDLAGAKHVVLSAIAAESSVATPGVLLLSRPRFE